MYTFDHNLFMALNFDGGPMTDRLMLIVSGTTMWLPLYALILWLVYRKAGLRNMMLFLVLMVGAIVLADMFAGIFKQNGVLGSLLPGFEPRLRPMFSPELEGLTISPDSLSALRRSADTSLTWAVHVPREAISGRYGTVSAHAGTVVALAVLSASVIRKRWCTLLMILSTLLICYSRIYLAKHFPMDLAWGTLTGIALGGAAFWAYVKFKKAT